MIFYCVSTKVSSKHLIKATQFKSIVKKEFVLIYGKILVVSGLFAKTLHVAQQLSNFSNLNIFDVVVSVGLLLIGISNAVLQHERGYNTIGLVLQKVLQFCPKYPLSQVCRQVSFWQTFCWRSNITLRISAMQFSQEFVSLLFQN